MINLETSPLPRRYTELPTFPTFPDVFSQEWAALEARNSRNRWSPPEDSAALVALEAAGYRDMHQSEAQKVLRAEKLLRNC